MENPDQTEKSIVDMGYLEPMPQKVHHQFTDKGYDYVAFEVRCGVCEMLLFEFVHKQRVTMCDDRLLAIPAPNPPMGAESWYKPAVRVVCGETHSLVPVKEGEDLNQVVTSRQMSQAEWEKWSAWLR